MEELLKHLTEVSIRQQQIMEHMASRQGETERELAALRLATAPRTPLPDPRVQATQLLPRMTTHDDVTMYLQIFETVATREAWPEEEWARIVAPLLTGEAQRAYFALPPEQSTSYEVLRKEILGRMGLSPISAAQLFNEWTFDPRQPARAQAASLSRLAQHWLLAGGPTVHQVAERVVVDRLLRALPRPLRQAAGMRNPTNVDELVEAIELAEATQHREVGERAPPFPRRVVQERPAPEGTQRPVSRPAVPGPQDEPMPTEAPRSPGRPWLAGCTVHTENAPRAEVKINGRPFLALLDSGSAVSLVKTSILPPRAEAKTRLPITCVHGDTREVPARRVTIAAPTGAWPVDVGLVRDLPVPVLLGRDWPGFDRLLAAVTQPASLAGNRPTRKPGRKARRRPVLLASDSPRGGESPRPSHNLYFDLFQQVTGAGGFSKEQHEDDRLKHCWARVRVAEGKELQPAPHPTPHFIVDNGLLYCVAQRRGEEKTLLVVPHSKTEAVIEIAHAHPMAGHLVAQNTIQRLRDRFHWPGLEAEVRRFCQACQACRVGIPSQILTDQGTPFMSRMMAEVCNLLKIRQLRTTVYHPQTDGLVERFSQTLKQMLRRVAAEDKRDWDQMLPYVLFGIREIPQASTGFTPFELLFGRQPRGLLDVAREAWEQQPAVHRTTIEHVREMRERIDRVMPIVREHLVKPQQAQQRHYNRAAQPREFQRGDHVLVLVPTAACKFLATWQGPYTVTEKVGPVTYRVRQPGKRKEDQLYHVNLLKRWVGTGPQLSAYTSSTPVVVDMDPQLSAAQKSELQHLVSQFPDVFSPQPGRTHVVEHDVRTPPGTIVRQRPYRVPEARRHAIEDEVQEMLRLGVIEPSRSPWSSPIVMVPKPDGTLRFCNDFRRLNEVSEFDGYPMPRVDELLDRLGRARFISTLDLTKGYWQVPLTEQTKPKTAFSTPSGHWQYQVLPFGLHGAPATFQRLMDVLLRPHQAYAAAYIDDVVIHSHRYGPFWGWRGTTAALSLTSPP
uniref:Gypsy retrotransposon integrase-like protein 1 n=1 Tax=Cyprinus carpio carpio TaxID=630221 RepID=A0A9J7YCJ2_CYPCA